METTGLNTARLESEVINSDQQVLNSAMNSTNSKEKLKKVAEEFESIFISKMFSTLDKTVDRENGLFGQENSYYEKLKSYMFDETGRQLAHNPRTSFGFAKQIYEQMEKFVD